MNNRFTTTLQLIPITALTCNGWISINCITSTSSFSRPRVKTELRPITSATAVLLTEELRCHHPVPVRRMRGSTRRCCCSVPELHGGVLSTTTTTAAAVTASGRSGMAMPLLLAAAACFFIMPGAIVAHDPTAGEAAAVTAATAAEDQGWKVVLPSTTALPSTEPPSSFNRAANNILPAGTSADLLSEARPTRLQTNKFYSNFLVRSS